MSSSKGNRTVGSAAAMVAAGGMLTGGAAPALESPAGGDVWITVADSMADFSGTQGGNGWFYRFDRGNGTPVQPMPHFLPNGYDGPVWSTATQVGMPANITWCMLRADACHPNSSSSCGSNGLERPIREWRTPVPMMVRFGLSTSIESCSGGLRIDFIVDGQVVDSYLHAPGGPTQFSRIIETRVQQSAAIRVDALNWCNCDFLSNHRIVIRGLDCDGNGIVDEIDVANGAPDANGNGTPDSCECLADLDASGSVNSVDLAIILAAWGTPGGKYPQADIDRSGVVDASDLTVVLGAWGPCTN